MVYKDHTENNMWQNFLIVTSFNLNQKYLPFLKERKKRGRRCEPGKNAAAAVDDDDDNDDAECASCMLPNQLDEHRFNNYSYFNTNQ